MVAPNCGEIRDGMMFFLGPLRRQPFPAVTGDVTGQDDFRDSLNADFCARRKV